LKSGEDIILINAKMTVSAFPVLQRDLPNNGPNQSIFFTTCKTTTFPHCTFRIANNKLFARQGAHRNVLHVIVKAPLKIIFKFLFYYCILFAYTLTDRQTVSCSQSNTFKNPKRIKEAYYV